jgi:hypothetical protein
LIKIEVSDYVRSDRPSAGLGPLTDATIDAIRARHGGGRRHDRERSRDFSRTIAWRVRGTGGDAERIIAKEWKSVRLPVGNAFETAVTFWHKPITPKARPKGENVVDLMNALKRSIANGREPEPARSKKPRKAAAGQRKCCCQSDLRRLPALRQAYRPADRYPCPVGSHGALALYRVIARFLLPAFVAHNALIRRCAGRPGHSGLPTMLTALVLLAF